MKLRLVMLCAVLALALVARAYDVMPPLVVAVGLALAAVGAWHDRRYIPQCCVPKSYGLWPVGCGCLLIAAGLLAGCAGDISPEEAKRGAADCAKSFKGGTAQSTRDGVKCFVNGRQVSF